MASAPTGARSGHRLHDSAGVRFQARWEAQILATSWRRRVFFANLPTMARPTASPRIAHAARARLFDALAKTLDAGLPADRALLATEDLVDRRSAPHLAACALAVQRGTPLVRVLTRAGFVTGNDSALLEAGEHSGTTPRVLAALARRYERLHKQGQRMRARLMLPLGVLAIGVLTLPLPALASGSISAGEYLLQTLAAAGLVGLLLMLGLRSVRAVTRGALPAGCERWPLLGGWLADQARVTVLEQLQMLLEAGLPAHDAVRACKRNAAGGMARRWLARLARSLAAGEGLSTALSASGLLDDPAQYALLSTGEAAGRTDAMLARIVDTARGRLDVRAAAIAEWTPRVVYALIVAVLAAGYFST